MCHVNCMVIFDSFVDLVTCQGAAVAIWVAIAGYPIRYDRAHLCLVTRQKKIARRPPPSLMSLRSCSKTARLIDSVLLRSHRVMPGHPGGYDPFPPAPALLATGGPGIPVRLRALRRGRWWRVGGGVRFDAAVVGVQDGFGDRRAETGTSSPSGRSCSPRPDWCASSASTYRVRLKTAVTQPETHARGE